MENTIDNNIETRLEQFRMKAEAAVVKHLEDYPTLREMEEEQCAIINEGNSIRKYLIEHKEIIDENSYLYLTNQVQNQEILDEKYKCLQLIILISKNLFDAYREYSQKLIDKQEWSELVNIYGALFNITGSYYYKKAAADVLFKNLNDVQTALEIYKQIETHFAKDNEFYHTFAQLYSQAGDNDKAAKCEKLASEYNLLAKAKEFSQSKDFEKAIEMYEKLFDITKDAKYKLEIANIHAVIYDDIDTAVKIYKQQEKSLANDLNYWYKLSELYEFQKDYYRQVLCMQKAIHLELNSAGGETAQ